MHSDLADAALPPAWENMAAVLNRLQLKPSLHSWECASGEMLGARPHWARWIGHVVIMFLALSVAGCATSRGLLGPLQRAPAPTVEQLAAPLRERAKRIETLWMRARVSVRQSGRVGRGIFDATVLAQPPAHLRLRAYRSATIPVFDLLADAKGLRFHDTIENRYYAAEYGTLRRANSPWAGLSPSLLFQAVVVEQTILDRVASARSTRVRRRWKTIELRLESADDQLRVVFDRLGQRVVELTYEPASGEKPTWIRYGEMMESAGVRLPRRAEIKIGPSGMRMRLDISEYKMNQTFVPRVFSLDPPPGQRWLPLEMLR